MAALTTTTSLSPSCKKYINCKIFNRSSFSWKKMSRKARSSGNKPAKGNPEDIDMMCKVKNEGETAKKTGKNFGTQTSVLSDTSSSSNCSNPHTSSSKNSKPSGILFNLSIGLIYLLKMIL